MGQEEAVGGLADALLAGELGHTPRGRPRSLLLLLGPTGTGKTKAVTAASAYLFGTECMTRVNAAEFSSAERVPLLLGTAGGEAGLLGERIAQMRAAGGHILLLDEIEKAHPSVADLLLGIEEAAITLANGETLDLSDLHIIATSNLGSAGVIEMEGVARASVRRFVEQEAAAHFRPEVLARFTSILVFGHLSREVQMRISSRWGVGSRLSAMFGSDIAHWDVPDQSHVLDEAWELVEHELITTDDFADFVFGNPVRFHAGANPGFFKGTVVEAAVEQLLAGD